MPVMCEKIQRNKEDESHGRFSAATCVVVFAQPVYYLLAKCSVYTWSLS